MVSTVKFNVGGKHFEVSRALIDANPDSMLAKMISETWEQEPENRMFIDRDGDKFAHVLDYMRYGSIELPATVSLSMFQRELDYYGIKAAAGTVTQTKKRSLGEIADDFAQQDMKSKTFAMALECFNRFQKGRLESKFKRNKEVEFNLAYEHEELMGLFNHRLSSGIISLLNGYLDNFGLTAVVSRSVGDNTLNLSLKK